MRGVSPVVGCIILVAITVVASSFVIVFLGQMAEVKVRPDATLEVKAWENTLGSGENDYFEVFHLGGDSLLTRELKVWVQYRGPGPQGEPAALLGDFSENLLTTGEKTFLRTTLEAGGYYNIEVGDLILVWIVHKPSGGYVFRGETLADNAL